MVDKKKTYSSSKKAAPKPVSKAAPTCANCTAYHADTQKCDVNYAWQHQIVPTHLCIHHKEK